MTIDWTYIIQVNIGITLFYIVYKVFCSRDTFIQWHRYALMGSLILPFILPLIDTPIWFENSSFFLRETLGKEIILEETFSNETLQSPLAKINSFSQTEKPNSLQWAMWGYFAVVFLLSIHFIYQIAQLIRLIQTGEKGSHTKQYSIIYHTDVQSPFSFVHWIFLPKRTDNQPVQDVILKHEIAHICQIHFIDIICGKIISIIFWINPFIWLLRKEIELNLEYLADYQVTQKITDYQYYQYQLLNISYSRKETGLYNNFNVSHLKSRIMMMHKKSNNPIQRVKYAIYLPIAIALLFLNHPKATAESQTIKGKVVVSGTVKNADGMPIVGAPVNFKGDNSGTLTDEEGSFKLFTIPGKQTLVITHLGSQNREIPLVLTSETSHRRLDIILGESKTRKTIIGSSTINSKLTPSETKENSSESDIFEIVEEMPKFQENLNSYISKNTRYPEEAKKQNIGGIVHVKFTIEKDGSISNIKIIRGVDPLLDEEAIRVIENMPKWKPGKHNGKAVRVNFTMPITFKL